MPRKIPRFVNQYSDRSGRIRTYFRRNGGPSIPLPNDINTKEFSTAYSAALNEVTEVQERLNRILLPTSEGFVYFLRTSERIKIGFSTKPLSRYASLKTGMPTEVNSFAAIRGTMADEKRLHRVFAKYRLTGEWFSARPEITATIMRWMAFGRPIFDGHAETKDEISNNLNA